MLSKSKTPRPVLSDCVVMTVEGFRITREELSRRWVQGRLLRGALGYLRKFSSEVCNMRLAASAAACRASC